MASGMSLDSGARLDRAVLNSGSDSGSGWVGLAGGAGLGSRGWDGGVDLGSGRVELGSSRVDLGRTWAKLDSRVNLDREVGLDLGNRARLGRFRWSRVFDGCFNNFGRRRLSSLDIGFDPFSIPIRGGSRRYSWQLGCSH